MMTMVDLIEAILRGGAAAISFVLVFQLIARRPVTTPAVFGALFLGGVISYSIIALPLVRDAMGAWCTPFKLFGMVSPAFFWLFIVSLNDETFRFRPWMALPGTIIGLLFLASVLDPDLRPLADIMQLAIVAGLLIHTVHTVRCCLADDLVASRRMFARTIAVLVPVVAVAILAVEIVEMTRTGNPVTRLAIAMMIFGVTITLALSVSSLRKTLLPDARRTEIPVPRAAAEMAAADRIDLGRLRDLMEEGAYLSPGLTIGELAQTLSMPEHRLRKLINKGLGYRNFATFLHDHRIREAQHRLAEPGLVNTQITNLAFDVGYASLAPFNRAFRERTGMSPSEWREKSLGSP